MCSFVAEYGDVHRKCLLLEWGFLESQVIS